MTNNSKKIFSSTSSILNHQNSCNPFNLCITPIDKEEDGEFKNFRSERTNIFNSNYTFSAFVVGSNNNLAYAASVAVSENLAKTYNPLFLYGGSGLGKTHLLHAIANRVGQRKKKDIKIIYTTSENFTYELVNSIKNKSNHFFRNKYRNADLVLVDDVQFFSGRERTQEEFFNTFNALFAMEKQIVLASDCLPSKIPQLEERLKTRFKMGLIADVQAPDFETRIAILKGKFENLHMNVSNEVLEYIAENIKSNVRELEGAVGRICAYLQINKTEKITKDIAVCALNVVINSSHKKEISIDLIIKEVEKHYKLPKNALVSQKKSKDFAFPRQIAMYISRLITDKSLPYIGKNFGSRDHTTVLHAVNKIKKLVENKDVKNTLQEIITNINRE